MPTLDWRPLERAIAEVEASLSTAEFDADKAADSIKQQVSNTLESTGIGVLDALIGAVSAAGELASGLLESLAATSDFWASLFELYRTNKIEADTAIGEFFWSYWYQGANIIVAPLLDALSGGKSAITNTLHGGAPQVVTVEQMIADWENYPRPVQAIINVAILFANAVGYMGAMGAGVKSQYAQRAMASSVPTPLSVAQLTELLKRGDVGEGFAKDHAKRSGVSGELFDLAYKLERQRLTPDHYITAWLRTKKEAHIDEIRKLGVAEDDIERLLFLAFSEPTPSDIVRFLVRDAYDEEAVRTSGLDTDFDIKYRREAFDRVGVSEELARLYWRAHWQLPSPTQGFEMLYKTDFTIDQLRNLLKLADYAPAYIDNLINIAYNVPGRIDLRNMWSAGIITDVEELKRGYKRLGYNDADQSVLAQFAIAISDRQKATQAQRKRAPIAAQVVRSYLQGTLSADQSRDALVSLGFTVEEADYRLREGEYGRERDRVDRIRDAVGRLFTKAQIDADTARSRLAGYGFSSTEIELSMDSWIIDRELRDLTDAEKHERDLSRADIVAAFEAGILAGGAAYDALVGLGYDPAEADTILELSAAKTARADAKLIQDSVRVQLLNRRITRDEASSRLDAIGTRPDRRDALLDRWVIESEEKAPDLPIAWLERLIMNAQISEDDAADELRRRGFTEQEVDWALRLWGSDVGIARERLEQQGRLAQQRLEQQAQEAAARISVQERALALRERTATTAQVLQQERFQQTLEQRERLQAERIDAQAASRVESAALQAERDAKRFAATKDAQARALQAASARQDRQIAAASARQEDAQAEARQARSEHAALTLQLQDRQDARQAATIRAQIDKLTRQIASAEKRASDANALRQSLQASQQAFQDQQRQAREAADAAKRVQQEAARIRQESRGEARTVRTEERGAARRTIERAGAAIQSERLRSLQLQRDQLIAELQAQLAALEATAAEQRIATAEETSAAAQRRLDELVGPALAFESTV